MPNKLERKLRRYARRKGMNRSQTAKYVWGTMRRLGWKPKRKR
jgi:hypothetical protein